ncbi:MAG: peptidoglycan-binding protein [Tolypothrix sp. Co-bin9]|nr:peptidoglycan-binding protein [Tolypothrix sp. Co-bin9]
MKGSQTVSRCNYLQTSIASRFFSASKFYLLPLCFATPVLIGSTAVVSFAAPPEIAQQVGVGGSVNRPTLKLGSQGERVSELQGTLKLLGYYTGAVDGNFNQTTANAVSQFKQAAGLPPDGIVDANTWARLFPGEGTVASSPASPNPAANFPTPEPKPSSPRATTSSSQTTVRQSSPSSGTSTSTSEQTLRTTSTDGAGQTSRSEQTVRTTSTNGSRETVRTTSTTGSGETVRTRQTPRNQTSSSRETVRTPQSQTSSSGQTTRTRQASTSGQTPRSQTRSSGQTTRTRQASNSGQTTRSQTSSSGQTTRQTPSIQYTAAGMPILRVGMRGPEVVKLQERLKRLGFLDGSVDGDFGASTEAAVKAAQQRYGLEADGVAGGATWDALSRRRSQPR